MKAPKGHKVPHDDRKDLQVRLGAAVKAHRQRLGVTQEELAWRADLHRTYLADIERGSRNVTLRSIANLARALQVSIARLVSHGAAPVGAELNSVRLGEILLVEDNPDDAELALRAFKRARFTNPVKLARSGRDALDYVFRRSRYARREKVPPHLVLLDLNLPDIPGLDVLRELKASRETRSIPVVVLTMSQLDVNIIECGRLGAENYIVKPVDFDSITKITPALDLQWALVKRRASGRAIIE